MASSPLRAYANAPQPDESLVVRLIGNHQRVIGLEVAINGEIYTTDANGEIPSTSALTDVSVRLVSSEFRLYEQTVDIRDGSPTLWVQANPLEATGLYRNNVGNTQTVSLNRYEVETAPGSLNDPVRAVQALAPVGRAPLNSAWLLVRGGRENDTSQSLDGMEVPNLLHLGGYSAAVHPMFIESTTLTASGLSAELGRALSGNLNLKTAALAPDVAADAGVDIINGHMFVTTPAPGGAAAFSIRRSWLRSALKNFSNLGADGSRIAPSFFDANARWEGESGSLHFIGLSDNIDLPSATDGEVITARVGSGFVIGHWNRAQSSNDWSIDIRGRAGSHQAGLESGETTKSQVITSAAVHAIASLNQNNLGAFRAGIDSEVAQATASLSPVTVDRMLLSVEPWAEATIGGQTFLSAGLRYSNFVASDQLFRGAMSPRIRVGTSWGGTTIRAYLARLHQAPNIGYLTAYPEGHDLAIETSNEAGAGVEWANQHLSLSSSLYVRALPVFTILELDGTVGQGQALAAGAELAMMLHLGRLRLDLTGAVLQSQQREEPQDDWSHSYLHHPIELGGLVRWELGDGWTLSTQGRFTGGSMWDTKIPTATDLTNNETIALDSIVDDDGRLPSIHSIDLKLFRSHSFKNWHLSFYIDLQNVTNHRGPELIISGFESTNGYGIGMPFLPVIGVAGRVLPKEN